jgi:hypothetical protein
MDALLLQLKCGEMKMCLVKESLSGVIIRAEPQECREPLFALIDSEHLPDNFMDEDEDHSPWDHEAEGQQTPFQLSTCTKIEIV